MNEACTETGCTGSYDEGYCDECGTRQPTPGTESSTAMSTSPITRSTTSAFTSGTRTRSRGGIRDIAPVPVRNPSEAVLTNPSVPESKRFCSSCGKPVGRTTAQGQPGRTHGFCPHCRTQFSFIPSLANGDLVDDRYEILGAMAHGGLGWIYLARDKNLGDDVAERWVVLKGLIDTNDADAIEAAIAERRFLATLDHPNIVQIFDFVRHPDPRTNEQLNYIVMEYIPGRSLRDLRRDHTDESGTPVPLPLVDVLTYAAEILPAMGYLHQQGLLYCDFKPDNIIHVESWLKLIDLGAVRRIDDHESAVFGTPGYSVSEDEIINHGPSVSSDLYTVGRSMAVMSFDFHGFTREYRHGLPDPATIAVFSKYESYYRLLLRATHSDPSERFESAEEMREQLLGVKQEVLSVESGHPQGKTSVLFTPEQSTFGAPDPDSGFFPVLQPANAAASLPIPLVDSADPAAGFLATLTSIDPTEILAQLKNAPQNSPEVQLRQVRTSVAAGDLGAATQYLEKYAKDNKDWRIQWWRAVIALIEGRFSTAKELFNWLYGHLPGEVGPILGLAVVCELTQDHHVAERMYARIWETDNRYVSAAYGKARLSAARDSVFEAITVLDSIPATSSQFTTARVAAIALILGQNQVADMNRINDAATRLTALDLRPNRRLNLTARILTSALQQVGQVNTQPGAMVLGHHNDEKSLRFGLEKTFRDLAQTCTERADRIRFIDQANSIRPWTLI